MKFTKEISAEMNIDAYDLGADFAQQESGEQAEFLFAAAKQSREFSWCMQSSMIARQLYENYDERGVGNVIHFLETLLDHIKNPA